MDQNKTRPNQPKGVAWLGSGEPRDDKVLSPAETDALLATMVAVEEKLDGANLGFSVGADGSLQAQNRGQYLRPPFTGQFARLGAWLAAHEEALFDTLDTHLIAFGEWCAARHALNYTALPDWWLAFDVYDRREGRFWSARRRDAWAQTLGLPTVPALYRGRTDVAGLMGLLSHRPSRYHDGPLEGVIIRAEDAHWLQRRAKLVRPDFTQQIEGHWRGQPLEFNHLAGTVPGRAQAQRSA